ncbi:hypothetical protein [Candidatus Liberibacter solanacearum]|nr:hypothetical protein [Candidatus Liberibacter solanacearum]
MNKARHKFGSNPAEYKKAKAECKKSMPKTNKALDELNEYEKNL